MKNKLEQGKKAYIEMPVEVKKVDKEAGSLEAVFSTQDVDRHGDVVVQAGWELGPFKKNPVILNSHNYNDAAEVIGKASGVKIDKKKLQGKITFAVEENPKAKVIFDLYAGGFLNAFSVGFIPKKFKENRDGSTDWFTIEEAELLEVSAVSVPANARALAKQKGIDVDALEVKKEGEEKDEDKDKETNPDDETGEDDKDKKPNGEEPAGDGGAGEGGEEEGDEAGESGDGDHEDEVDNENKDGEETEDTKQVKTSYKAKVMKAISNIEYKEKKALEKAAKIINSLLENDPEAKKRDAETNRKIKKRKVNQAIRNLMQIK